MASEAYVKVTEVLKDAPALASVSSSFLVAGVIKSRYGKFEPEYITSRRDLLDKFTCDGKLSGKCDISLINAYEVLGSSPILVTRAASKAYVGAGLGMDDNVYSGEYKEQFGNKVAAFDIVFKDFMSDPEYQVSYNIQKSEIYPGAVELLIKYERIINLYKYKFASIDVAGTGAEVGDVVELKASEGTSTIKVKVIEVGSGGEVTAVKLVTSVGSENATSFEAESGLKITVTSTKMPNEEVKSYNVIFSLDENVVDDKGNSLYYKNVWDEDYPFEVSITDGTPVQTTVANPYVANDPTQEDTITYMDYGPVTPVTGTLTSTISGVMDEVFDEVSDPSGIHWSKLENYEARKVPMLSDFGTPNIGGQLKQLANIFSAIYCISLPRKSESVNGAKAWDDIDLGNSRRYAITPFAQTTHLGFVAYMAPTTQYIKTICNNALAGREYEAAAGSTNGVVGFSKLTKNFDKSEREALLDLKINTITYRETDGYAMINDDLTGLVQNNPFKEEFNRRLGVTIAQDIDTLMQQFKFQLNTAAMRDTVESVINTYFKTVPFKDKIYAYEVKCNDDNNPPSLQAQNKLAVTVNISFYYTAKYIEVVNNIYSVGQSFSE